MIYDLADTKQLQEAADALSAFGALSKTIELKVKRAGRTSPQNRGLHLLLGALSNMTGYTLSEVKELYKAMNKDLYYYTKPAISGQGVNTFIKSSSELDSAQMAKSIDRLYEVCNANGITLPLLTNEEEMRSIEREMEKNSNYN